MGSYYISAEVSTTIATPATYVVMASTTVAQTLKDFTHSTPGRLTYTGTATKNFNIAVSASTSADTNNTVVTFSIAKNGTADTSNIVDRKVAVANDHGALAIHVPVQLATNNYIEIYITADKAADVDVDHGTLIISEA